APPDRPDRTPAERCRAASTPGRVRPAGAAGAFSPAWPDRALEPALPSRGNFIMALILPLSLLLGLTIAVLLAGPLPFVAPLLAPALIALGVLYKRPAWGILGLVAMIPVEGLFPEGSAITGGKLVGYTLILVVALQLLLRQLPEQRLRSNLWKLLLPFLLCYVLSILYSRHLPLSLETLRQLAVGLSLFVLTLLLYKALDLLWLARLIVLG